MNNVKNEDILYIPYLSNKIRKYNLLEIYTPRKFNSTEEYIKHMENLRKLKNYDIIIKHLDILDVSVYKTIITNKLNKLNWKKKIKEGIEEENNRLNELEKSKRLDVVRINNKNNLNKLEVLDRCKSSLDKKINETNLNIINKLRVSGRCKSSLDKKINKSNINELELLKGRYRSNLNKEKKNIKLPKIKR